MQLVTRYQPHGHIGVRCQRLPQSQAVRRSTKKLSVALQVERVLTVLRHLIRNGDNSPYNSVLCGMMRARWMSFSSR